MKPLSTDEIRTAFIKYFESKGHTQLPGSSIIPYNDKTLLFTNAGMVQFKDIFLGLDKPLYKRAVTVQRCLRAGGKHNDLEAVGRTARHHTFFEMLGNFSFGDYFKREAITYAWEFLTKVLEIPKDKLTVTVFEKDEEAAVLWLSETDVDPTRILKIGAKDNFWSMGDTGPCGPCSEIFYDRGAEFTCTAAECAVGKCDCDRWMEIWNIVFMQYNRDADGNLHELANKNIDTGMGLERMASVLQQKCSNYDTDVIRIILDGVIKLSGREYSPDASGMPFRVIADHVRAAAFMIADGIAPSNEGRGYVLRRIIRRAVRYGMSLGLNRPFLFQLYAYVRDSLGGFYPQLISEEKNIVATIRAEEESFHKTLASGLNVASDIIDKTKQSDMNIISGTDAFTLYDTYGFPLDLTKDIAEENGLTVDETGFAAAMDEQRQRARASRKNKGGDDLTAIGVLLVDQKSTVFCGYDRSAANANINAIIIDGNLESKATNGDQGYLVLDSTPFYAESGGQIGDSGIIDNNTGSAEISEAIKLPNGVFLHKFQIKSGEIAVGDSVSTFVDISRRKALTRNHTATHLLHKALRDELGDGVRQAGSFVGDKSLRFDFTYQSQMTAEQITAVEEAVNRKIFDNLPVAIKELPIEEAKKTGAIAFFGDKYGDIVRVVSVGDYSVEFCGGCHCRTSSEIGIFKIISESGIGSGLRRIEAVSGENALAYYRQRDDIILEIADKLKCFPEDAPARLENLLNEQRSLEKELDKLQTSINKDKASSFDGEAFNLNGINVLIKRIDAADINTLRSFMDMARDKITDYAVVLAAPIGDKVSIVAGMSAAAQAKGLHAGEIVKAAAVACGGNGGGKADMAQAGGKDVSQIDRTLQQAEQLIKSKLSS